MELPYITYAVGVYSPHSYVLSEYHFLERPHPGEVQVVEQRPDVADASGVAVQHPHVYGGGPHR